VFPHLNNASTATAFGLAGFPVGGLTGQDNDKYNGPYGLADKTAYLTAINNPANWVANDSVPYDLSSVGPRHGATESSLTGNATNAYSISERSTSTAAHVTLTGGRIEYDGRIYR
jgi:hypothetical protein